MFASELIIFPPFIQMFYSTIESLVFNKEPEDFEDSTMPEIERQDKKIDDIVDQITGIFGEACSTVSKATKRPPPSGNNSNRAPKVPKTSSISKEDICSAIRSGAVITFGSS